MLDSVGVQQVGTEPAEGYIILSGIVNMNRKLGTGLLILKGIISAVKRVEFVSNRMLRGRLCDTVVLNRHVA
jgi:hypothetical protein